jgi:pyruvate formate lyase activating enzyme
MREVAFSRKVATKIQCQVCPHFCRLTDGQTGICGVRRMENGTLYAINYGICEAMAMDPVEKKPLYHFYPGRNVLSVGTIGCNLDCGFCQNWHLARGKERNDAVRVSPEQMCSLLDKYQSEHCIGIAYTYSEPNMWYEYVLDTAALVQQKGYKNIMVTNGFLNGEPLKKLLPFIDAFNIDVKSFNDEFYRKHCGGRLAPVLHYVEQAAKEAHVELTYLVIPT